MPLRVVSIRVHRESVQCANEGGGGRCHKFVKNLFTDVQEKLFWGLIYCANPRPDAGSQYGSCFRGGLGSRYLRIIREYTLTNNIAIRTLIQPCTCEMVSSIFAAMIWFKFASTTRASLPSMPSTERKNGVECFRFLWKYLLCLSLFIFSYWDRSVTIGSNL